MTAFERSFVVLVALAAFLILSRAQPKQSKVALAQVGPEKHHFQKLDNVNLTSQYVNGFPSDCAQVFHDGKRYSGVYEIWPRYHHKSVKVFCDMTTASGGWTVFQKRGDFGIQENFQRGWSDYKNGFGSPDKDYWLGNDLLFALTHQSKMILRIQLKDFEGTERYAQFDSIKVESEQEKYKLTVGKYSGNAEGGDAFIQYHSNKDFSTIDRDNTEECAYKYKGGWWYSTCHSANLNGLYLRGQNDRYAQGVVWQAFRGHYYSLKETAMMIRPKDF